MKLLTNFPIAQYHWLKVDFNKWRDEDDSEDDVAPDGGPNGGPNFEDMMRNMGDLGGGGIGGNRSLDGLDDEADSDDEGLVYQTLL